MLDGLAVELVGSGIGEHRGEQFLALLIRHLLDAIRARASALGHKDHHAAVPAVDDEALRVCAKRVRHRTSRQIGPLAANEPPGSFQRLLSCNRIGGGHPRDEGEKSEPAHVLVSRRTVEVYGTQTSCRRGMRQTNGCYAALNGSGDNQSENRPPKATPRQARCGHPRSGCSHKHLPARGTERPPIARGGARQSPGSGRAGVVASLACSRQRPDGRGGMRPETPRRS